MQYRRRNIFLLCVLACCSVCAMNSCRTHNVQSKPHTAQKVGVDSVDMLQDTTEFTYQGDTFVITKSILGPTPIMCIQSKGYTTAFKNCQQERVDKHISGREYDDVSGSMQLTKETEEWLGCPRNFGQVLKELALSDETIHNAGKFNKDSTRLFIRLSFAWVMNVHTAMPTESRVWLSWHKPEKKISMSEIYRMLDCSKRFHYQPIKWKTQIEHAVVGIGSYIPLEMEIVENEIQGIKE